MQGGTRTTSAESRPLLPPTTEHGWGKGPDPQAWALSPSPAPILLSDFRHTPFLLATQPPLCKKGEVGEESLAGNLHHPSLWPRPTLPPVPRPSSLHPCSLNLRPRQPGLPNPVPSLTFLSYFPSGQLLSSPSRPHIGNFRKHKHWEADLCSAGWVFSPEPSCRQQVSWSKMFKALAFSLALARDGNKMAVLTSTLPWCQPQSSVWYHGGEDS